jgi:hypothetical protein
LRIKTSDQFFGVAVAMVRASKQKRHASRARGNAGMASADFADRRDNSATD